jgi:hypothetical protein
MEFQAKPEARALGQRAACRADQVGKVEGPVGRAGPGAEGSPEAGAAEAGAHGGAGHNKEERKGSLRYGA